MPSPGFHLRRERIHTPDPRLLSFGRCGSLSPALEEEEEEAIIAPAPRLGRRSSSLPLEEEDIIAQIILMFAIDEPRPDPRAVRFLLDELKTVRLPYHVIFNKIDLVDSKAIAEWEVRLQSWGVYPVTFVSFRNYLGLHDLDSILVDKSSLLLGPHNVGKTSLVEYVTKNRSSDAKCDLSTVLKKAGKWLVTKCDASLLIKEDFPENPHLHSYCIDL